MHKLKVLFIGIKNEKTSQQAIKFLKKQNISLKIIHSKGIRNEIIQKEFLNWKGDLILHFRSYIKLPNKILQNCKVGAINFHPSTPKYPGSGGINWALYNIDKEYGITVHLMNNKIDNGEILKVYKFPIIKGTESDHAIDISSLRSETGFVTIDYGFKNTGSTKSKIISLRMVIWERRVGKSLHAFLFCKKG